MFGLFSSSASPPTPPPPSQEDEWTQVDVRFSSPSGSSSSSDAVERVLPECDSQRCVTLFLNGVEKKVYNFDPEMTLATYIRENSIHYGTKVKCQEGGCGVCAVVLSYTDSSGELIHRSCNSCLRPLVMCDGMSVTTTEGIGNHKDGFHPIQQKLASENGSQCGYCSPGMVMSMYGLVKEKKGGPITQREVEERLDGNICRCTGYFGILNAFKAFAQAGEDTDSDTDDDEDLHSASGTLISGVVSKPKSKRAAAAAAAGGGCGAGKACCGGGCGGGASSTTVKKVGGAGDIEDVIMNPSVEKPFPAELRRTVVGGRAKKLQCDGVDWYRPSSLDDLLAIAAVGAALGGGVKLVAGNTSRGVWRSLGLPDDAAVRVDLRDVAELHGVAVDYPASSRLPRLLTGSMEPVAATPASPTGSLTFGASVSLSDVLSSLQTAIAALGAAQSTNGLEAMVRGLQRVANVHVRNVGSWAGNLSMALNQGFPSDVATMMAAAGARVTYYPTPCTPAPVTTSVMDFLSLKDGAAAATAATFARGDPVLLSLCVPFCATGEYTSFFKAALRSRNAHALVNAGFRVTVDSSVPSRPVISAACVVYGAVNSRHAVRCVATEAALVGRALDEPALQAGLRALSTEVVVEVETQYQSNLQPEGKQAFREALISRFFYKYFLHLYSVASPTPLPSTLTSAATDYLRRVSAEREVFSSDASSAPVNQPIPKRSALLQAAGQAKYSGDAVAGALHGALVTSSRALATITGVDTTAALAMPGVVDYVCGDDVPTGGTNGVGMFTCSVWPGEEPVFATDKVEYNGQPLGMIVARSRQQAEAAAAAVVVSYADAGQAVTSIDGALAAGALYPTDFPMQTIAVGDAAGALASAQHRVSGVFQIGNMRHFYMETQTTAAIPDEDRIELRCSTQMPDLVRQAVSVVLGCPGDKVALTTRRVGGAYGGKLFRPYGVAAAAAIAAVKFQQPVVLQLSIGDDAGRNMGRTAARLNYDVGFDASGRITAASLDTVFLASACPDAAASTLMAYQMAIDGPYYIPDFKSVTSGVRANLPPTTALRAPGYMQAAAAMETVIEAVAAALNKTPEEIREVNMYTARNAITPLGSYVTPFSLPEVWARVRAKAKWDQLQASVAQFNSENKWRKRGACMVPVKYGVGWIPSNALVVVQADGSVFVTHGHVEMGQGIHTRVAQVAAATLGCDISMVKVCDTNTQVISGITATGGSMGTGSACEAVRLAALKLADRLRPVKEQLLTASAAAASDPPTWNAIIGQASADLVDLSAEAQFVEPGKSGLGVGIDGPYAANTSFSYFNFGACVSSVEVDVLTGEVEMLSSHIVYDCGKSVNPLLDIGQVEGAFVMGLGFFLHEENLWDSEGVLRSPGTWEYKPPAVLDVPQRMHVELLRNSSYDKGVLRSKSVGEPPKVLSYSALGAVRAAVGVSRTERNLPLTFRLDVPATVDRVQQALGVTPSDLTLES